MSMKRSKLHLIYKSYINKVKYRPFYLRFTYDFKKVFKE